MPDKEISANSLQTRVNDIVSGKFINPEFDVEDKETFSFFNPEHAQRASALASYWMIVADKKGGLEGLNEAINEMESCVGHLPIGMVERSAKQFLTHHATAREHLTLLSLEKRKPDAIKPSINNTLAM